MDKQILQLQIHGELWAGVNLWGTNEEFVVGWGAKAWNDGEWGELLMKQLL